MYFSYCSFIILVIASSVRSVKLNIEGKISVGQDIMDSLTEFLDRRRLNARRSLLPISEEDSITTIVRTAVLCKDSQFCFPLLKFVEEYVIVLAKSVQTVLSGMMEDHFKTFIFEGQLKQYLEYIRNILENPNSNVSEEKEVYNWIDLMKRICAKFQEMASIFVSEESQIDPDRLRKIKRDLSHKIIISTIVVEMKYQTKLCMEHGICIMSFGVTRSLNNLFEMFESMPDEKVRLFIRYFYEALFDSGFYSHINQATAHEMQVLLNDMAYSKDVATKDILSNLHEIVKARIESLNNNTEEKLSHDAFLIHAILSDMDHFGSKRESDTFTVFFQHFHNWIDSPDFRIDKQIRLVMEAIGKQLWTVTDDFLMKLVNEVKVFLELSLDSGKTKE